METYSLFDDKTASRIVYSFYDPDPGKRVKIDFPPGLSDSQVRNSADEGVVCAYQVLRRLGYIGEREDYYLRCRFADTEVNFKALGDSAGLGFSLKFAQEVYREKTGQPLNFSIAATGVIDEQGCKVGWIKGINSKLEAAVNCLKKEDQIFYPSDNEEEIDPDIKAQAKQRGILLIPVSTVEEATKKLLPEKVPVVSEKTPIQEKRAFRFSIAIAIFILFLLTGLYVWQNMKPLREKTVKCEVNEFLYKNQYESARQEHLKYLEHKQRFDNLRLFVKSIRGVRVPIHPVRLYIANQQELIPIVEAIQRGKTYPDKANNKIVLIAGGPGVGKSAFLKWLACPSEDPECPSIDGKIAMLDLGRAFRPQNRREDPECRQEPVPATYTTLEEDLKIDDIVISSLPKADANLFESNGNATETLYQTLSRFGFFYDDKCERKKITSEMSFTAIVVDSIDEVEPSSSRNLLELLTAYKKENPEVTIIAAGRGEGFREYVITNTGSYEYHHLEPIFLSSERLIEWRINDWLLYKLIVSEDAKNIPRAEVTFNDLESVEFKKKVKDLKHRLDEAIKKDPWLRNFLFLLLPSNKLFSNLYYHPLDGRVQGATKDIRKTWASSIFERSCRTHNRPSSLLDLTRFNLYKEALQQAARKAQVAFGNTPPGVSELNYKTPSFILSNLLDDVGIEMKDEVQPCVKVSTIRILERSGFVDIFPIDGEQYNVMFFPPVAQEILAGL
jgi:hypothetical protein